MEIYVLRHGQTDYNVQGRFQGQVNTELNDIGREQARIVSEILKDVKFDMVISSPLNRAIETAKIVTDQEIVIERRLIERSFGKLEGKKSLLNYEEKQEYYGIETMENLFKRVYEFLDELKIVYNKNKILLVTHEGIAQVIQCYFKGIPKEDMKQKYRLNTGEYKKYVI